MFTMEHYLPLRILFVDMVDLMKPKRLSCALSEAQMKKELRFYGFG